MGKKNELDTDLKEIRKKFEGLKSDTGRLGLNLVDRATFMQKTLKNLEQDVEKNGEVTEMVQGSYSIQRQNPALQAYTGLIKQYQSIVNQIINLLPKEKKHKVDDFDEFE